MISAHATHPGLVRRNNEDCVFTDDSLGIYLLADGMGGHNAGEVASALAVETAYGCLKAAFAQGIPPDAGLPALLSDTVKAANNAVFKKSRTDLMLIGMGTTVVIAVIRGSCVHVCHVGDSRAYHFTPHPPQLHQLTADQTTGDQLVLNGTLTREQVPERYWHTLTQAVGIAETIEPEYCRQELAEGDILLLCSDGLTDMVPDDGITGILAAEADPERCAERLVDAALANGGRDNVSVVIVQIHG
jgi:protein phosphatase